MYRFVLPVVLLAAPALAQDKEELCTITADIAGAAASERAAGEDQAKTTEAITADLEGQEANYAPAVEHIVGWVWTLPEDQLTDEVGPAYKTACLAQ